MIGIYEETKSIWRPEGEHKIGALLESQLLFSFIISFIFTRNYEAKGIGEGLRFGLLMGLLLGSLQTATYCYLPIPLTLLFGWIGTEFLKGLGAGIVASLIYRD